MDATNPGTIKARKAPRAKGTPAIGVPCNATTLPPYRSPKRAAAYRVSAAIVAPQGHAITVALRALVARRNAFLNLYR